MRPIKNSYLSLSYRPKTMNRLKVPSRYRIVHSHSFFTDFGRFRLGCRDSFTDFFPLLPIPIVVVAGTPDFPESLAKCLSSVSSTSHPVPRYSNKTCLRFHDPFWVWPLQVIRRLLSDPEVSLPSPPRSLFRTSTTECLGTPAPLCVCGRCWRRRVCVCCVLDRNGKSPPVCR